PRGKEAERDRREPEERCGKASAPFVVTDDARGGLRRVVERSVLVLEAGEPAPPRRRGGVMRRQLIAEDLVEPVARPAELVEAEERGDGDHGEENCHPERQRGVWWRGRRADPPVQAPR